MHSRPTTLHHSKVKKSTVCTVKDMHTRQPQPLYPLFLGLFLGQKLFVGKKAHTHTHTQNTLHHSHRKPSGSAFRSTDAPAATGFYLCQKSEWFARGVNSWVASPFLPTRGVSWPGFDEKVDGLSSSCKTLYPMGLLFLVSCSR